MISQLLLLLQKDFTELARDRGFLLFVLTWLVVFGTSKMAETTRSTAKAFDHSDIAQKMRRAEERSRRKEVAPERAQVKRPLNLAIEGRSERIKNWFGTRPEFNLVDLGDNSPAEALTLGIADVVLKVPVGFDEPLSMERFEKLAAVRSKSTPFSDEFFTEDAQDVTLLFKDDSTEQARRNSLVDSELDQLRKSLTDERFQKLGLGNEWWRRYEFKFDDTKMPTSLREMGLPVTLPFLIMFAIVLVTSVFSIELVCVEQVRGTLQQLIISPISRISILACKTIMVSVTAFSSLASAITMTTGSMRDLHLQTGPLAGTTCVLLLATPLTFLLSSWSVFVAMRCRTRGRAVARLMPGTATALALTGIAVLPGIHCTADVALIPIANVASVVRDFLLGHFQTGMAALVALSSVFYGIIAMQQAAAMLEDYGELDGHSPLRNQHSTYLFQLGVVLSLATVLTTFYFTRQIYICDPKLAAITFTSVILIGAVVSFGVLPQYRRRIICSLHSTSWKHIASAALLAPLIVTGSTACHSLQQLTAFPSAFKVPFIIDWPKTFELSPVLIVALSIVLAISQEAIFRGALQGLFKAAFNKWMLAVVIGVISGICQPYSSLFVVNALLGMALSLIVSFTGSVYPAVALHVTLNILASADIFSDLDPVGLQAMSILGLAVGAFLLFGTGSAVKKTGSEKEA